VFTHREDTGMRWGGEWGLRRGKAWVKGKGPGAPLRNVGQVE